MTDRVNEVINALEGSCGCLEDHATEEEMRSTEFLAAIDDAIFCCATCGWWCEISELAEDEMGEQVCEDCHEE